MSKQSSSNPLEKNSLSCRQYAWSPEKISLLRDLTAERVHSLTGILSKTEKSLDGAPEGKLRICSRKENPQYYHRKLPSDRIGEYIPAAKSDLVEQLAQKAYNEQVLDTCRRELAGLNALGRALQDPCAEELFDTLSGQRKKLVEPVEESEDAFIEQWRSISYQGVPFESDAPEFYTGGGLRVRSKSELIIAEWLDAHHIPFLYEFPLKLQKLGTVHPDFLILDTRRRKAVAWEHLGMMDDPDYASRNIRKVSAYIMSGYLPGDNLIITAETKSCPLNMQVAAALVRQLK